MTAPLLLPARQSDGIRDRPPVQWALLSCRRSWQAAARELNVHRQTVVYRMERVAELTGRTLTETPDIAELWLALSAHELLTGEPVLDRK